MNIITEKVLCVDNRDTKLIKFLVLGTESPSTERSDGDMYRKMLSKDADIVGNELSAPYEIPQFPIEQIQSKLQRVRGDGRTVLRQTSLDTTAAATEEALTGEDEADLADLVPDFQRVNISGEDNTGVPVEDLHTASELLIRALSIRERYMNVSYQEFPSNVQRHLDNMNNKPVREQTIVNKATIAGNIPSDINNQHPV